MAVKNCLKFSYGCKDLFVFGSTWLTTVPHTSAQSDTPDTEELETYQTAAGWRYWYWLRRDMGVALFQPLCVCGVWWVGLFVPFPWGGVGPSPTPQGQGWGKSLTVSLPLRQFVDRKFKS